MTPDLEKKRLAFYASAIKGRKSCPYCPCAPMRLKIMEDARAERKTSLLLGELVGSEQRREEMLKIRSKNLDRFLSHRRFNG
jgi:hypothetical protein